MSSTHGFSERPVAFQKALMIASRWTRATLCGQSHRRERLHWIHGDQLGQWATVRAQDLKENLVAELKPGPVHLPEKNKDRLPLK